MLLPLALPPGIVKNGTPYQRRGRWIDSNLIRWYEGSIRAIGGWIRRADSSAVNIPTLIADPTLEAYRDGFAWRSLDQSQQAVFGSNLKLKHMSQLGVITDITPAGMVTTDKEVAAQAGYGNNPYGIGAYGVANDFVAADPTPPRRWAFDNYGEILLIQQRGIAEMYELDLGTLTTSVVTNAPEDCQDLIVTEPRIVFTVGADNEPRLVKWSDSENRNLWAAAADNQAGEQTLAGSGRLLRCINVLKQILIVGENDAYACQYLGPPYIFGFDLAGRGCGAVCAEAVVGTERLAVWWGDRQFWLFDGALQQLNCEVIEFLYDDLDITTVSKISAFSNQQFSEVWWLYQSVTSTTTELDSYVCWNYRDNTWITGRLDRTMGIDKGTLRYPVMVASDGIIYTHEQAGVQVDGTAYVESGIIDLGGGEKNMAVRYIYPDTEVVGDVQMLIKARQFPSDTEYEYGPYAYTNPTPTRALGREVKFRFTGLTAGFEIGVFRADLAPMGTGRR